MHNFHINRIPSRFCVLGVNEAIECNYSPFSGLNNIIRESTQTHTHTNV